MFYRSLNKKGVNLNLDELKKYLEKIASDEILSYKSDTFTYPIPKLKEDYNFIFKVYSLLNEHIKLGIPIHPAGEWLLDNFYIIEEAMKNITKNLSLKKYKNFISVANGEYKGFARIYSLCLEIVTYTDYRINSSVLVELLRNYQKKKNLSMEEIWNIGLFIQIGLINGIREISEKIYFSQIQKYKVENIVERLVDKKNNLKYKDKKEYSFMDRGYEKMKYPFIEYMSFVLKKYGKVGLAYIKVLEEQVNKMGYTLEEEISKEHFDIAVKKVSMANAITSLKEVSRINIKDIFEKINEVEDILKKDPAKIYEKMDYKTKEYYRNAIKVIAKKSKMSEIYIASCALELSLENNNNFEKEQVSKKEISPLEHIGYYLIGDGKKRLYEKIECKMPFNISYNTKVNLYIYLKLISAFIISILFSCMFYKTINSFFVIALFFILSVLASYEIINKAVLYVLRENSKA